jgi:hypothetical protein
LVVGITGTGSKIGAEGMEVAKAEGGAGVPEERRENGGGFDWPGFFKVSTYSCLLINTGTLCPFICSLRKKEKSKNLSRIASPSAIIPRFMLFLYYLAGNSWRWGFISFRASIGVSNSAHLGTGVAVVAGRARRRRGMPR